MSPKQYNHRNLEQFMYPTSCYMKQARKSTTQNVSTLVITNARKKPVDATTLY